MRWRLAVGIVAFFLAAAIVEHNAVLPEYFIQLRDPNLLGGYLFRTLTLNLGHTIVLAVCGIAAALACVLIAWRAYARGMNAWQASLAVVLVAFCFSGRLGLSLDPLGWFCAALFCLLLDRDDTPALVASVALVAIWGLLQGGATLGALLAVITAIAALIDAKQWSAPVKRRFITAAACLAVAAFQLHALPWQAYGPHALYLDSLLRGAQRDRIWSANLSPQAIGFTGMIVVAGWYGLRRRGRTADALIYLTGMVLALIDARNLPYFAILSAAPVADAVASYYLVERKRSTEFLRSSVLPVVAAACVFAALAVAIMPASHPQDYGGPEILALDEIPISGKVLCTQPRWCDEISLPVVLDDRAGIAGARARKVQYDVASVTGAWRRELRSDEVDAIVTAKDSPLISLLKPDGWHVLAVASSQLVALLSRTP